MPTRRPRRSPAAPALQESIDPRAEVVHDVYSVREARAAVWLPDPRREAAASLFTESGAVAAGVATIELYLPDLGGTPESRLVVQLPMHVDDCERIAYLIYQVVAEARRSGVLPAKAE